LKNTGLQGKDTFFNLIDMNKLVMPNGGLPLYGDDFNFLDAANRDAFKAILYEFAKPFNGFMLLGGCEITGNSISEGYVLIDYEPCYFAGATYPNGTTVSGSFALSVTPDPSGTRSMANGSTNNPYQLRKVVFNNGTLIGGATDYPDEMKRLSDSVHDILQTKIIQTQAITAYNGWVKELTNLPTLYRQFRNVHLNGGLVPGTITANSQTKILQLPLKYRPLHRFKTVVAAWDINTHGSIIVEFFPNGEVYAVNTSATVWDLVSLNVNYICAP
jgi:hypothetical protein